MSGVDEKTRSTVQSIPMCTVNAGPRDGDKWVARLKEEFTALIKVRLPHRPARGDPARPRDMGSRLTSWAGGLAGRAAGANQQERRQ